MNAMRESRAQHFLFLDAMRGIAAIMVMLLHWLDGNGVFMFGASALAVDYFFMLSGFVVARAYEDRLIAGYDKVEFLTKRLIRLYPLIALGMLAGFLRFAILDVQSHGTVDQSRFAELVLQTAMIPQGINRVTDFFPLNNALWSLHFEILAYVLFCLVIYRLKSRYLLLALAPAFALIVAWATATFGPQADDDQLFGTVTGYVFGLGRVVFSFLFGAVLHRTYGRWNAWPMPAGRWLALLLIIPLLLPTAVLPAAVAVALILIVFPYLIMAGTKVEARPIAQPLDTFMGNLSYPLYALHIPIIWTFSGVCKALRIGFVEAPVWNGLFILPATIAIVYIVFLLADQPVRNWLSTRASGAFKRSRLAAT